LFGAWEKCWTFLACLLHLGIFFLSPLLKLRNLLFREFVIILVDLAKLDSLLGMTIGLVIVACCWITPLAATGCCCILVRKIVNISGALDFGSASQPE
jgi:hypothetical protein